LAYPVTFEADYVEKRSRVTAFFRLLLAIPVLVWLYLYGIAAAVVAIASWFVIVITGRFPEGMYKFLADFIEVEVTATAYTVLLSEPYPPFLASSKPDYPVRMYFAGPLPTYSRAKTFFRLLLAIPILILRYVANFMLEICAFAAWVVSVVLGRVPRGLFDPMVLVNSYIARSDAYLLLLTETYPPFQDDQTRTAGLDDSDQRRAVLQEAAPQPAALAAEGDLRAPEFDDR
jgi:Domain of unknown function (DUF4389)